MLTIKQEGGRFLVYETSTTPWLLVDAFDTEYDAKICLSYHVPGELTLRTSPWSQATLQEENIRCCLCRAYLEPGKEVFVKTTESQFNAFGVRNHYEFKCLWHIPTRFQRINGE